MTNVQSHYDVIIVGGGHNGLVCANYLAKSGRKVLILEANESLGGAATTRKFTDNYSISGCAHWLFQLSPKVASDLGLAKHGLKLAARNLNSIALAEDGNHITMKGDGVEGGDLSEKDQHAYQRFNYQMLKFSKLLAVAFESRAPKLLDNNLTDRMTLAKLGLGMKMLGKENMRDLLRLALINIYDVMEENFDNELLKAAICVDGVMGSYMGPRSPNTVFGYLYRRLGDVYGFKGPAVVEGGMGALGNALATSAMDRGVDIQTKARVGKINLSLDKVTGVTLTTGEDFHAKIVVSNADPKSTLEKLVGFKNLETGVVRRVSNIRMRGSAAKLHLALNGMPNFGGLTESQKGQRLLIAPSMNYIEQAFNSAKYGEYSIAPVLDISIPSVHDPSLAPAGAHVLSAIVQYAPHDLKGGWDSAREPFKNLVIERINQYAPGIKEQIVQSELLTPEDLEGEFNMTGGHWHHGEISLDQIMMMRPFPGASQYATSVSGLFLCGAGAHPGGGVMGLAGKNAAKEIIKWGKAA
ncbi:MAG: NAD(P)/FAD-dependent oxidoreductase [Pseudomonadota bacterium]|nr:NAD(P)/FAD-dependent oxidoreductase [Pseudomonadota bacterium]